MGSTSLSLLGGLPTPRSIPKDSASDSFLANNVWIAINTLTDAFTLTDVSHILHNLNIMYVCACR